MKDRIIQTLRELRAYALGKGYDISLTYHEEDSYLMRFANSAISLNTNEHLIRLEVTAHDGRKRASFDMITDLGKMDEMKKAIDSSAELVKHAQPLNYEPTLPTFTETFIDESGFDPALSGLSNQERLAFFNKATAGLETSDIKLSGIFSNGATTLAQINTRSEHIQYFKTSDAQATVVLAHATLKWEVQAEQSAWTLKELNADHLHAELVFLLDCYQNNTSLQLPLGTYDIIFGPAATADLLGFMNYIGFNGGLMKRGYSFLSEEKLGQKVFSEKFSLDDDTSYLDTFPIKRDAMGKVRGKFPIFKDGVFQAFCWSQDDADEFATTSTEHTVMHKSLVVKGGTQPVKDLSELAKLKRERDALYIPFLHYMNIVNPSKAIVTASSRFGALLFKKDGSIQVPYNVRVTQSLLDIFGDKVAWLSQARLPYNTSASYGARNPTALVVPLYMQVNGLEISHSNPSY